MILRFLLYLLYLFIPIVIVIVTMIAVNITSFKETTISYTLSSKNLINPKYIYFSKPEDIMYVNHYYHVDEVINMLVLNDYIKSNGTLKFDLENFCDLNFVFQKKELQKKSFDEFKVSINMTNTNETIISEITDCINLFIDDLNQMLFLKFNKDDNIERINYNINVLDLIINSEVSKYIIDTEKYYSDTRAQIIINTLNIIEKQLYDAIEKFELLNKNYSISSEENIILKDLLETLNIQENILKSFTGFNDFSEDIFSFTPKKADNGKAVYYKYIIDKLKELKDNIINDEVTLKIKDIKIDHNINDQNSLITPGFILFILLLSSLIIIIIEFFYRKFRN